MNRSVRTVTRLGAGGPGGYDKSQTKEDIQLLHDHPSARQRPDWPDVGITGALTRYDAANIATRARQRAG